MKDRENEPDIKGGLGAPPEWFNDQQRAEWKRLSGYPHVNESHYPTAVHHCILNERLMLDATGQRDMTASERQSFHSIQMQMGFTAASSSKVSAPSTEKPKTGWSKFKSG